ncbi:MAG TPA: hypothetical protein VGQ42_12895 [Candidatus Dormibacteraeota bacterium]|jgi:alkylhydroperoxidase family enzyme|nr:hypothetical protein [Candidatus Dormibacteraeota bacterium]
MQPALDEAFYDAVAEWRTTRLLTPAERIAVEYAELYALDHESIDDAFFVRLSKHWDAGEVLELTVCIARHLGFGRLTKVLAIGIACPIDATAAQASGVHAND